MKRSAYSLLQLTAIIILLSAFASCNSNENIPFPEKALGFAPPVTIPLVFTNTQKLTWDTMQSGGIKPTISKLDIEALPTFPFDTTGFRPFAETPKEVRFDFNSLPEIAFNIDALPNRSLEFKTSALAPPVTTKTFRPGAQKDRPINIYDLGLIDGLPAKFIGAVFKDSKGLLWIGAKEGLFRYDGQYVQTILRGTTDIPIVGITEDRIGKIWILSANGIAAINTRLGTVSTSTKIISVKNNLGKMTTDSDGNIWVYNASEKALSIIDPTKATYKNITNQIGLSDSLAFEVVQDKEKRIWVSTYANGANIIDIKAGKIKYLTKASGLSSNHLSAITTGKNGEVLLSGAEGFDLLDLKKGRIKYYNKAQGLRFNYTLGLTVDSLGQIWRNTNNGIDLVDMNNESLRSFSVKDGLSDNLVSTITEDNFNNIWVSSTRGLNMIEQYGKTTRYLTNTNIISLMEDALGNIWVGTNNGIIIINAQRTKMRMLKVSDGLSDNFVQSFTSSNGNMIVATNRGYNIIDPVRKTLLKIGKSQGFPKDTIYAVLRDREGNTWFTGPEAGIAVFDSSKNIVIHTDKAHGLSADAVLDLRQDLEGRHWLVTRSGGVNVIDKSAGTVSSLIDQHGLKDTSNKTILVDVYGRIWIGTYNGIRIADTKARTLTQITTDQGLSDNNILSMLEYNGSVCAGTYNKINIITAPVPGSQKDTTWKISILKGSEGLLKIQNSWSSDCITSKGEYFWGDAGITVFNTIKPTTDFTTAVVEGISIMNQPQYFAGSSKDTASNPGYADRTIYKWQGVSGIFNMPLNLVIPHQKNYLQFHYGEVILGRQDTTWFVYLLEGIDKNWSAPTINTTTENYLNLPAGNYTFKVSSKSPNGKWSSPASFSFTISPPWYRTWWAYTLYALLGAIVLRAYIVYRSAKLQKENKELEERVALRTKQLQQSLEDLKSTQTQLIQSEKMASLGELTAGIAHEIQNPLNFVNNFSELSNELIDEMKEELATGNLELASEIADDIKQNLEKINHHGRRAESIVTGMLQHSRSSSGQKELTDINKLIDEYVRLSYHGLRAKDKSFNCDIVTSFDDTIGSINIIPQEIGRVILNVVNNAFYAVNARLKESFGQEKKDQVIEYYKPVVRVTTIRYDDNINIEIADNGNGIPEKIKEKIFQPFFTTKPTGQGTGLGLSLSYDIIKAHGGEIKVETKAGEDTVFIIILPV